MLEVGTQFRPRSNCRSSSAQFVGRAGGHAGQVGGPGEPGRAQVGQRHPVGAPHRGVAAGQRHVAEVREAAVAVVVGEQELAAPHGAVVAVAGAVEGDADHRPAAVEAVLGHRRGDVRVVVLDAYDGPVRRVAGRPTGAER